MGTNRAFRTCAHKCRNLKHFDVMAERLFLAPDGTRWHAWDVIPGQHSDWPSQARRHLPEALGGGWLCFESVGEKRRLHPIPSAWDSASDLQLWDHCVHAAPVLRRTAASSSGSPQPELRAP